jgi:hypothetical protein
MFTQRHKAGFAQSIVHIAICAAQQMSGLNNYTAPSCLCVVVLIRNEKRRPIAGPPFPFPPSGKTLCVRQSGLLHFDCATGCKDLRLDIFSFGFVHAFFDRFWC